MNSKHEISFIFYDLKATWGQTITLQDVKRKVKILNKRFDFNEDNIKDAFISNNIQSAVLDDSLSQDSCVLKFKYRVKNCILNYEWSLKKQNLTEQTFVQPLLLALLGCHQQIEILTDSIRKKDIELKQFRVEGAVLNRKTVVTKPFDFENFNKKFEDCNRTVIDFQELANYLKHNESKKETEIKNQCLNINEIEKGIKSGQSLNADQIPNTKMSPRHRKRKVNERRIQHLQQHLTLRRKGLEYESSQSQTASSINSQNIDEVQINDLKEEKQNTKKLHENDKESAPPPRRSARCTSTTPIKYYMSAEDTTDSISEDDLSTFRQKKRARSLLNVYNDSTTNSKSKQNSNNISVEETKRKFIKTVNLPKYSRMKSPEKSQEISQVFDFSNDDEGVVPFKECKNLQNVGKKLLTPNSSTLSLNKNCGSGVSNISPARCVSAESAISINSPSHENLSQSTSTPVLSQISSQLSNIKKELETLEAMRLADLKQRMCKT